MNVALSIPAVESTDREAESAPFAFKVAVVIPSYRVSAHILGLIEKIPSIVTAIYVVDDACPEKSGLLVEAHCRDERVRVLYNPVNLGVGGTVMNGYRAALEDGCDVVIKLDGDGQMDPELIPLFITPLYSGEADYVKGNRFFALEALREMPFVRLFGNAVLSFVNKAASGYWNIMDPTNGYTAIHRTSLAMLPFDKIDSRYFFESDILFRLNTVRAVVAEVPMAAQYADEKSNLSVWKVAVEFPAKYLSRFLKRIFYNYVLRDFNICSMQILSGLALLIWGSLFGSFHWYLSLREGIPTHTGTIMLAVLPVILGFQLLLAAASFDSMNIPHVPLQRRLRKVKL